MVRVTDASSPQSTSTTVMTLEDEKHPMKVTYGLLFKGYIIVTMSLLWTMNTIMLRYTRSIVPSDEKIKECFQWRELLKGGFPSVIYALNNNLDFVALGNLDAGLYQITTQLKLVTTATFMMLILGRRFSCARWAAIFLLFIGVVIVQLNNILANGIVSKGNDNYILGICTVLLICVTSGFSSVYIEKMLKGSGPSLWVRSVQMYSIGFIAVLLGCLIVEGGQIWEKGFFYGYDWKIACIVLTTSVGGVYSSFVMKYLDNMHKNCAGGVTIILIVTVSYFIFPNVHIGVFFILGSIIVLSAVLLYNYVSS